MKAGDAKHGQTAGYSAAEYGAAGYGALLPSIPNRMGAVVLNACRGRKDMFWRNVV